LTLNFFVIADLNICIFCCIRDDDDDDYYYYNVFEYDLRSPREKVVKFLQSNPVQILLCVIVLLDAVIVIAQILLDLNSVKRTSVLRGAPPPKKTKPILKTVCADKNDEAKNVKL